MTRKNVVIAVTDLKVMKKALPNVVEWLKRLSGEVQATLLYVLASSEEEAEEVEGWGARLSELADEIARQEIEVEVKLRVGSLPEEVVREAEETEAFAIVVAADDRVEPSRMLSPRIIEEMMSHASCPLVVFKPKLLKFTDTVAPTRVKRRSSAIEQNY